jgi:hypothetical protein
MSMSLIPILNCRRFIYIIVISPLLRTDKEMQKRITKINEMKDRIERLVLDVKVALSHKASSVMFTSGINPDDVNENDSLM